MAGSPDPPLSPPPEQPARPPGPSRPFFSPWTTAIYAILTTLLVGVFYYPWGSPLESLQYPEESLQRLVGREMDFREVLDRAAAWERRLYALIGSDPESFDDAIARYGELDEERRSTRADLDLAVLLGESGQLERAADIIEALEATATSGARSGRWLAAAYQDAPTHAEAVTLAEEIRRELPPDWFTDTLVRRLASRVADDALQAGAEASVQARGSALLRRVRLLTGAAGGLLLVGLAVLWRVARSARGARVAEAPLPPAWSRLDGWGLFFRAAFGYLLVPAVVVLLLPRSSTMTAVMGLAGGLPMLWWTSRYLHARGDSLRATFGLQVTTPGAPRVLGLGLMLLGISLAGETFLHLGFGALGVTAHWADGFLEELVWGSAAAVAATGLDGVIWAPLFEEIAFRGLLYPTLRLRLRAGPAALLSAAIFSAAHGYGLLGFAAVTWSGMVWALGYERTRSLLPGMVAHAASNLLATGSFLLLLRF